MYTWCIFSHDNTYLLKFISIQTLQLWCKYTIFFAANPINCMWQVHERPWRVTRLQQNPTLPTRIMSFVAVSNMIFVIYLVDAIHLWSIARPDSISRVCHLDFLMSYLHIAGNISPSLGQAGKYSCPVLELVVWDVAEGVFCSELTFEVWWRNLTRIRFLGQPRNCKLLGGTTNLGFS